jgi:pyruvate,water dikinase
VILQRQVRATRAGVAFSRDPVNGRDEVLIECARGSGDRVVSGLVTPDHYWVSDGRIRARAAGLVRALRDDEVRELVALVRRAEDGFGRPVDVEFCYDRRTVWLVQCRPITTL